MENDEICCVECMKRETDNNKIITCLYCFKSAHFKCRGYVGNAIRRARDNPYFCSTKCSDIYKRIMDMQLNQNSLITAISSQLDAVITNVVSSQMEQVRQDVRAITDAVESSQNFLSNKFDTIVSEFKDLKSENDQLKHEVDTLKRSHSCLTEIVHKLESNVDKASKSAVSCNAMVLGLPSVPNENTSELIKQTFHCIGVDLPADEIVSASRLYPSTNKNSNVMIPIRLTFKDPTSKDLVLFKKKEYGRLQSSVIHTSLTIHDRPTYVTIRDELTPLMLEILKETRELQKLANIKYVWTGRGGVILVKKDENSKVEKITNRNDLSRIKTIFAGHELRQDLAATSPVLAPGTKRKNQ